MRLHRYRLILSPAFLSCVLRLDFRFDHLYAMDNDVEKQSSEEHATGRRYAILGDNSDEPCKKVYSFPWSAVLNLYLFSTGFCDCFSPVSMFKKSLSRIEAQ